MKLLTSSVKFITNSSVRMHIDDARGGYEAERTCQLNGPYQPLLRSLLEVFTRIQPAEDLLDFIDVYPNWDARAPLPPAGLYGGYTQGRPIGGSQFRALTISTTRKELEDLASGADPEITSEMETLTFPCHVSQASYFFSPYMLKVSD